MSKVYIADKKTLDRVLEKTDVIIANLMAINNDEATKTKVAANYFNTRRTGKVFGVHFNDFTVSSSPIGMRKFDAVNMIARPSTDTVAERNDFDEYSIFNGLTVNGKVDANGEFVVTYFEGEEGFSKTDADVYVLFGTSWVNIAIGSSGETISVTDKPKDGYFPMPGAVSPNGKIRPFIPIAKYMASAGSDGTAASISGKVAYHNNASHNWCRTEFHKKGNQYCATTFQDRFLIETLFEIVFATRNSQSIMSGCTSYHYQYKVVKGETNVNRVILTKEQAANFVVGSCVSIGDVGSNTNFDRNQAYMHNLANRVLVTEIKNETIDGVERGIVYFSGAAVTTTATTYISSMPWYTGACDGVLGTCGSVGNNTNGKSPYIFFGVELANGQYEVLGNAIYNQSGSAGAWAGKYVVCYDATKIATASTSADYNTIGYNLDLSKLTAAGWKYVSELGFDKNNPGARFAKKCDATSSTGYSDGCYIATSAGDREVLVGGSLYGGARAGLWCRYLYYSLSSTAWDISARLSATGMCGVITASAA